ncbi:MAG: biopolymer transporter ExbD [Polyangiaceae bacterium]
MAGIDVGGGGNAKRAVNQEINMIPFIDLLMVTVAFLLITAVWVTNSQINVNADVPGVRGDDPRAAERSLHVHVRDDSFVLAWHEGSVVMEEVHVERPSNHDYHALKEQLAASWHAHGIHKDAADLGSDRLVLHTDNRMPYGEIVEVMDAVSATQREMKIGPRTTEVPAFAMTFATH